MIKKALVGLFAGFISGFFSTGGGMILVPAFVYLLDVPSKKARGTSIFCILMMVITSSIFYYKGHYINHRFFYLCYLLFQHLFHMILLLV